jgi:hypothetical protein
MRGGNRSVTGGRERDGAPQVEQRRAIRSDRLCDGTLACARCDAPVAVGDEPVPITHPLMCPFCGHRGPLRDFLSLGAPTRPARVIVRIGLPRP